MLTLSIEELDSIMKELESKPTSHSMKFMRGTRQCPKCKNTKTLFNYHSWSKGGFHEICSACRVKNVILDVLNTIDVEA